MRLDQPSLHKFVAAPGAGRWARCAVSSARVGPSLREWGMTVPELGNLIRRTLRHRLVEPELSADRLAAARTHRHEMRRRHRTQLAVGGAVIATAAAITVPIAWLGHGRSTASAPRTTSASSSPQRAARQYSAFDAMFVAAPPMLGVMPHGPAAVSQPPCRPAQIEVAAQLRRSTYGIVGVVTMRGEHCSIPMYPGPSALVNTSGALLDIPVDAGSQVGANIRPDLAFKAGHAAWGFAWTGSWCGQAPAGVLIPLADDRSAAPNARPSLTVPITGVTLPCTGNSASTMIRGAPGRIGDPVLPPPAEWSALTATLHRPMTPPYTNGVTVTLTNHSDTNVALDPRTAFRLVVEGGTPGGGLAEYSSSGLLPSHAGSLVPAHGHITLTLPPVADGTSHQLAHDTVTLGIPGGVTARLSVPIK